METLEIHVVETVSVEDIVVQVIQTFREIFTWVKGVVQEVILNKPDKAPEPTRGPPTLGINVSDGVNVVTKFGPGRK